MATLSRAFRRTSRRHCVGQFRSSRVRSGSGSARTDVLHQRFPSIALIAQSSRRRVGQAASARHVVSGDRGSEDTLYRLNIPVPAVLPAQTIQRAVADPLPECRILIERYDLFRELRRISAVCGSADHAGSPSSSAGVEVRLRPPARRRMQPRKPYRAGPRHTASARRRSGAGRKWARYFRSIRAA